MLPFDANKEEDKDGLNLNEVWFYDKDGKELSIAENRKRREEVAELARELAAQRLAKKSNYSKEELEAEVKKVTKEIIWGAVVSGGVKENKDEVD